MPQGQKLKSKAGKGAAHTQRKTKPQKKSKKTERGRSQIALTKVSESACVCNCVVECEQKHRGNYDSKSEVIGTSLLTGKEQGNHQES